MGEVMDQNQYIRLSLELHLFFDRIMKEHSFFLEAAFMEKDNEFKRIAREFQRGFSNILAEVVAIADGQISNEFINSLAIVTNNTLDAENKTSNLSGIPIDTNVTMKEINLRSGQIRVNEQLLNSIRAINCRTLPIIENFIHFKTDVLNQVLICNLYTTNYPLLISHILRETKLYYQLLSKVESKECFNGNYMYEQELFWNDIMKEHAEFIRGLLDPSENELILTADRFANDYENILKNYSKNFSSLTNQSLLQTVKFRDFKMASEEGILNCRIKSIILPLLADHVLREANHFIRILRSVNNT